MELINNFANLSKNLAENFRLPKSKVSLYLLAFIYDTLGLAKYREYMTPESRGIFLIEDGDLDSNTFRAIKDSGLINLKSFSKYEIRLFSEYLIAEYLKSANISLSSSNFLSFIVALATESALELHSPDNDEYEEWCIYISNVGAGDIVVSLLKNLKEKHIAEDCFFVGNEPDKKLEFLTEINYFIHKDIISYHAPLTTGDNPLILLGGDYSDFGEVQIAISLPPFINIQQQELQKLYKFLGSAEKIYFSELAYIELMLKSVSERGKVIAVVRNEFLSSKKSKVFREKYLKNDWIEKIYALPKEFANSLVDVSVIVFNKTKLEKGFIDFDGSEDKFEKTKISIEEIFSNGANLSVARYAAKESNELELILSKYPQDEVKKIKDLITLRVLGRSYSKNSITNGNNSNGKVPFIRVSELSKIGEDFNLDISKIEKRINPQNNSRKINLIDFDAVLVNLIGNKLKPTYFKYEGKPIVIGSDVIALKMNEDINIEYFLTQLHSRLVQIQVEMFSSGTTINRISIEDFLNIQILLPSLEEQEHKVKEFRDSVFKVAKEVIEAESERDEVEYQTIANMNHSLKNKLGAIVGGYDTLIRFLKRKERENAPVKFDEPIFPVREGENVEEIDTIATITERLKKHLLDASDVFNSFEKIEQLQLNKETVELVDYFKNDLKPLYSGGNYTIEVLAKPKLKLYVSIDKNSFKDIIENLIENARKHGFVSEDRKYKIVFELSEQDDVYDEQNETYKSYARILYKNDGKPFPKDFSFNDYIEYSNKAGKNQGMGIGGSEISRKIKKHGGKLNCITIYENDSPFSIQFEILLPLED